MGYMIFVCRKCNRYCEVMAGLHSNCCNAGVYLPQQKEETKKRLNPAI